MSFFEKFQNGLENVVQPFAAAVANNKFIQALTEGFMCTMPITLGVAVIAVLGNLPIEPWMAFLNNTGLYPIAQQVISLTLSLLAIYVVGAVGYCYTKNQGESGIYGLIISLASFIVLMPVQELTAADGSTVSALALNYMGSDGIFVALIVGLVTASLYCFLMKKNLKLKLPESVPPMVSMALAPVFVSMIIFTTVFFVKYACSLTQYGNIFNIISTFVGAPIAKFGATPVSIIIVFTLMNLVWFFGIHPNAILSCYMPVLIMVSIANQEAFLAGNPLPHLAFAVMGSAIQIGGSGNTLGLCLATLFAKSEKYKMMRKVVTPANLFNINEPVIFGFPIMLNPLYFIPLVFSPIVSGAVALFLIKIIPLNLNPTVQMPWVTPGFVTAFLTGGFGLLIIWIVSLLIHFALYLPFFLIDDKNALKQEQENQNA
ncbi:MAG: PTS transporter subunit EIIC [Bacillota bacterium]|nr:PTS transporter subunit EIIC [Bacillota bacterium]